MSDDDCDCSTSWHYSVNACEQHRKRLGRFIQTLTENSVAIQNMRGQGYYWAAKNDNGSKKNGRFKKSKIHFVSILLFIII